MSKTIRNEKTRGWLDELSEMRNKRRQARRLKADQSLFEDEFYYDDIASAM